MIYVFSAIYKEIYTGAHNDKTSPLQNVYKLKPCKITVDHHFLSTTLSKLLATALQYDNDNN